MNSEHQFTSNGFNQSIDNQSKQILILEKKSDELKEISHE